MRSKRFNKQTQINVLVNIKSFLHDYHCIFGSIRKFRIFFRESVRKNKPTPLKATGNGVDDGARTHDHWNHNPGLYQLSYAHQKNYFNIYKFFNLQKLTKIKEIVLKLILVLRLQNFEFN